MGIINEVFRSFDFENISDLYRYYNLGGRAVYIENFVRVNTFLPSEIVLKLKKGMIKVSGEELCIKELNKGCIFIEGKIKGVEVYWNFLEKFLARLDLPYVDLI